jgi:HTH-type transcriptional regulator/antitoxin HigA
MNVFPIKSDGDLSRALNRIEQIWGSEPGTPEGDELEVWVTLIEDYEDQYHDIPPADVPALILYKMSEKDFSKEILAEKTGWGSEKVSEVLEGTQEITLSMLQDLCKALDMVPSNFVGRKKVPRWGAP